MPGQSTAVPAVISKSFVGGTSRSHDATHACRPARTRRSRAWWSAPSAARASSRTGPAPACAASAPRAPTKAACEPRAARSAPRATSPPSPSRTAASHAWCVLASFVPLPVVSAWTLFALFILSTGWQVLGWPEELALHRVPSWLLPGNACFDGAAMFPSCHPVCSDRPDTFSRRLFALGFTVFVVIHHRAASPARWATSPLTRPASSARSALRASSPTPRASPTASSATRVRAWLLVSEPVTWRALSLTFPLSLLTVKLCPDC